MHASCIYTSEIINCEILESVANFLNVNLLCGNSFTINKIVYGVALNFFYGAGVRLNAAFERVTLYVGGEYFTAIKASECGLCRA